MRQHSIALVAAWVSIGVSTTFGQTGDTFQGMSLVHNPDPTIVRVGAVTSQGDGVTNANTARSAFNVNGAGIKVGIISDSFNALSLNPTPGVLGGDLPGVGNPNGFLNPVSVVKDSLGGSNTDEGRAMAEIVHDIAPGAQILFHSAFNNPGPVNSPPDQSIANAINGLVAAGAKIIVDDVGMLNASVFQDGAAAQAVNAAKAAGVAYFSAAGNNAQNAYQATYNGGAGGLQNYDANNNEGGDTGLNITVPAGTPGNPSRTLFVLHWDEPYATVGGTVNSRYNLEFAGIGAAVPDAVDPFVFTQITNTGAAGTVLVNIRNLNGTINDLLKLDIYNGTASDDDFNFASTLFGHPAAAGGLGVAAMSVFDAGLDNVEPFSTRGPVTILFDPNGNPINETRSIDITGPDGGNNSFFGNDSINDVDSFPNFFGTSAAAPHVAAVMALLMERANQLGASLTIDQLYNLLLMSATDIEAPGFDEASGFGKVNAFAALSAVPEPAVLSMIVLGAIPLLRRRQK